MGLRLALFQPDIAQNTGTMLRLGACLGVGVDVIEPCGFAFSERALRRAGLDYLDRVELRRHLDWRAFAAQASGRLVLVDAAASVPYHRFAFRDGDTLILGRESVGVPDEVRARAEASVAIPMQAGLRSLNVAVAAAMVLGEALRQTAGFEALSSSTAGSAA
jgi:tRNA (cytidine/uridine-2'-O-)-methyltransferase